MTDSYPLYPFYQSVNDGEFTPQKCADDLESLVSTALANWRGHDEQSASCPIAPGKWTTKQMLGHLCDSASNNLQRIVRLTLQKSLLFPRYDQERWVDEQRYDLRSLADLLNLFESMQRHLAHVIRLLDLASLEHVWVDGGTHRSLKHLLEDYLGHLQHHMNQMPLVAVGPQNLSIVPATLSNHGQANAINLMPTGGNSCLS